VSRASASVGVLWVAIAAMACRPETGTVDPSAPVAEAYAKPSDFAGEWVGESNAVLGSLKVKALGGGGDGPRRYYGQFAGDDGTTRFVLNFQQPLVTVGALGIAGNLARFTWQDGRGGSGDGWVLINPEDSALTGEIRVGNSGQAMDFVRVDEG
jgi:hypothetical protein